MQERQRLSIAVLPILGEPSAAIEPSKRAFDDPAFGQNDKSRDAIGSLDDVDLQTWADSCQGGCEFRSLIAAIGEQLLQKGKHPEQARHDENAAIAILNVGRMDNGVQQEP